MKEGMLAPAINMYVREQGSKRKVITECFTG